MARLGVTYCDIENAANQLLGQGKQPTIELIRQFLGTGSSTTIANHLRKWRQEQDGTLSLSRAENLPKEMINLMKGLWDNLCHEAQKKITAMDAHHQQTLIELQQELQKYKTNNQRWQQLFNQWQQEKAQLLAEKLTLEQGIEILQKELISSQTKIDSQFNQLAEKQERIEELNRLHSLTQANLEHYRESMREQRMQEQQQFDQQKQELQLEIKELKTQFILLQEKHATTQHQHQLLERSYHDLEKKHAQLTSKIEIQEQEFNEIKKVKEECYQASEHWRRQCQDYQKIVEAKTKEVADTQAEIKMLLKELTDSKQAIENFQDQAKLLGHEKWILAQEKAQLEGQLKQMQKMVRA